MMSRDPGVDRRGLRGLRVAALPLLLAVCASARAASFTAKGNLESSNAAACARKLASKCTPADLMDGVSKSIQAEKYSDAQLPYMLAFAYGRFDQERVADESAHDAFTVLAMRISEEAGDEKTDRFNKARIAFVQDAAAQAEACAELRRIGMPDYVPTYMIQHGMGAFTGQKAPGGLVPGFDGAKTWRKVLAVNMRCSDPDASWEAAMRERTTSLSEEGRAKGNLGSRRTALSFYAADHDGAYPSDLRALVPSYETQAPALKLPGLSETADVEYYDGDVCAGAKGTDLDAAKLRSTGKWGYVRPRAVGKPGAKEKGCVGSVFIDSARKDSKGKPWFRY